MVISRKICVLILFFVLSFSAVLAATDNVNLSTKVVDAVPPANVSSFEAIPGDQHISLNWTNPGESDFDGVLIRRSTVFYPANPSEGETVYDGQDTSFVDLNLTNGQRYYYTAFAYDLSDNFASGAIATAIPTAPSLSVPYKPGELIIPHEIPDAPSAEAPSSAKKETIEIVDFKFYILFKQGPLEISLNDAKNLKVIQGETLAVEIDKNLFSKEVNVITVTLGGSSYLMRLAAKNDKFQAIINIPKLKSEFGLNFIIIYKDGSIQDVKGKILVDPSGFIYERSSSFLGLGKKSEMRVEGADVALFVLSQARNWVKWDAGKYSQKNPIITEPTGDYSFLVPKGEYRLEIKKKGYLTKKSDKLEVDDQIVNVNIELTPYLRPWVWLIVILGAALIAFLLSFAVRKFRRKRAATS